MSLFIITIRCLAVGAILIALTPLTGVLLTLSIIAIVGLVTHLDIIQQKRAFDQNVIDRLQEMKDNGELEEAEPIDMSVDDLNQVITDASDEVACIYMGENLPVWIEVNNDEYYIFDGQHDGSCDIIFRADENTIVLPPGIQYRKLVPSNMPELAQMLKITVQELQEKHFKVID